MKKPVLLYQLGEAPASVAPSQGTYVEWYERAWGGPLEVFDGRDGNQPPAPKDFAAILLTGSASSLSAPEPWMDVAAELVLSAYREGVPTLGICFGHQLLGYAFGAKVVRNPLGWEIGTCEVELTEDGRSDKLFEGMGPRLFVNLSHQDVVDPDTLPSFARILGKNPMSGVQFLALGEHVRGVQFHPEFTGAITKGYIEARRALLTDKNPDVLLARTRDTPDGVAVLRSFRDRF